MKQKIAQQILKQNIQIWNKIAQEFNVTRQYIWSELKGLKKYAKPGMKVLDVGCGNGRLLKLLKEKKIEYFGIDNSKELIKKAQKNYGKDKFKVADALEIPYGDNSFDLVYTIAVLHIIPSQTLRLKFLKEIERILKKNGTLILTVWHLYQRKYFFLIVKYSLRKIFLKSKLDFKDIYIPWQNKELRYYHAFTKKELIKLFKKAGFKIKTACYLKRNAKKVNILIVAKKN
jgi:ubiquinone/menaquinone biosynthesis C-methylase UbiE